MAMLPAERSKSSLTVSWYCGSILDFAIQRLNTSACRIFVHNQAKIDPFSFCDKNFNLAHPKWK